MMMYWTLVIFPLLWSCSSSQTCQNQPIDLTDVNTQNLLTSMNYFAVQVIQKLIYNPNMSANVILSPTSIYASLALVVFGSAGDTQTELINALGFPSGDFQLLQKSFRDILVANEVYRSDLVKLAEVILAQSHVAEGLFIQQNYKLVESYASFLQCLNIVPQFVDFANNITAATNLITQWIINNNPKSDSMAVSSSVAPGTMLYITSIYFFSAKWQENLFKKGDTGPAPFYGLNNIQGQVQMMKALTTLNFYGDNYSYTAVEIPYAGNDFTAIFMLPLENMDPVQFVTTFSVDQFKAFCMYAQPTEIDLQIPTFSSAYSMGLKEPLQALGIKALFEQADVSNMIYTNQKFPAEVTHNAKILVDEAGTSAVALTTIALLGAGAPPTNYISFYANRPFLMLIRNVATDTIAFATFFHNP